MRIFGNMWSGGLCAAFRDNCLKKDFWLGLVVILLAMAVALTVNIFLFNRYHTYYTAAQHIQLSKDHLDHNNTTNDTTDNSIDTDYYDTTENKEFKSL